MSQLTFDFLDTLPVLEQDKGKQPHHSPEVKRQAKQSFDMGLGYKATADNLGLNRDTVKIWKRKYRAGTFNP